MKIKEFGSDFHYLDDVAYLFDSNKSENLKDYGQLCFSGRSAFYFILQKGIEIYKWKKVYIPSYYCHEVYEFVKDLKIEFVYYHANPINNKLDLTIEDNADTAILLVDYFGINKVELPELKQVKVIEDITHHIGKIKECDADFVFGSLRKCLPLPIGGFIKSKVPFNLFPSNEFGAGVFMHKLTGMYLKNLYLNGEFGNKSEFRSLLISAEEKMADLKTRTEITPLAQTLLNSFNVETILDGKKSNIELIKSVIKSNTTFELITSEANEDFACVLYFNKPDVRDALKDFLISNSIYPMVLWPDQKNEADKRIENNILFIHVDYRHRREDVELIGSTINQFFEINDKF